MSAEESRTQLVWQLVQHALRRANLPDSSRQTQELHSYAVRLLSSNLHPSTLHDEQSLLQTLKTDLERRGSSQEAARLLECHSRLCAPGGLDQRTRTGLLAVLARVSKDEGSSRNLDLGLSATSSLGLMVIQPGLQSFNQGSTGSGAGSGPQDSRQPSGAGNPAPYTVSFPPSLENSFTHGDSQGRGKGEKAGGRRPVSSILSQSGVVEQISSLSVNEPLLVRDVLYACQGVSGRFTTYNEDAGLQGAGADTHAPCDQDGCGGYVVAPEAQATQVERMLMARLTELGWLFRRVQSHVSGSSSARGAMRQALQGALQAELADYYRLMAVLDQHAAQPIPVQGEGDSGGTYLTLRRLVVWLSEPQRRMRVLALLADATAGKEGGALAGAVHALAQHGDPFVASFTNKVLQAVCVPLFDMIRRWVFEGVLEDPRNEFFVRASPWVAARAAKPKGELASHASALAAAAGAAPPPVDLWRSGYWLERRQLPAFISDALASKVLRAGKSINFLQGVCGDMRWAQEAGTAAVAAAVAADTRPGLLEGLERAVDTAATMVDARVMEVLNQRYHLAKHCDAVRRYLLLGQGDFIQAFMELVSKELNQSASNVSEMQLSHALRTAINSTCAKYDDDDILERLRAKKDRSATGGESGWDVLTLEYDVPAPLATIFTPTAMAQYLRVFQLLWRLKRAEASLAACWTTLQCQVHRTLSGMRNAEGVGAAEGLARRCLRLRADMSHFATNLQYYLMFEVMEAAWQEFNRRAGAARDLDALIAAHTDYLATLLRKALLDEGSQALRVTLGEMTTHMLSLHGLVHNLSEVVQGAERRLQDKKRSVQARTAAGQWGVVAAPGTIPDGVPLTDLAPLAQRVAELEKLHSRALQTFTRQLPAQAHDEVRFLLYRLDFNEFNSFRQS